MYHHKLRISATYVLPNVCPWPPRLLSRSSAVRSSQTRPSIDLFSGSLKDGFAILQRGTLIIAPMLLNGSSLSCQRVRSSGCDENTPLQDRSCSRREPFCNQRDHTCSTPRKVFDCFPLTTKATEPQ